MFSYDKFTRSTWARKPNGKKTKVTLLYNRAFWRCVLFFFNTTLPLVYDLWEVDSNVRHSMPHLYGMLDNAKDKIMEASDGNERWNGVLIGLHAATYYLNPKGFYGKFFSKHPLVEKGLVTVWLA